MSTLPLTTRLNDPAIFSPSFQQRKFDGPVKDPCDFVLKFGGEAFNSLLANAKHVIDYKFNGLMSECLQADPYAHAEAIEKAVAWFAQYIHARTDLEPDHPALMTPFKRGAILCRLARLSGLTFEEVRRIIDRQISKLEPRRLGLAADAGFPIKPDAKRDAVIEQLDALAEAESSEPWEPPDPLEPEAR